MPAYSLPPASCNEDTFLLAFPAELTSRIVGEVMSIKFPGRRAPLYNLALTCQALLDICRPLIFKDVTVRDTRHSRGFSALVQALNRCPDIRGVVKNVTMEIGGGGRQARPYTMMVLQKLCRVKTLRVSSASQLRLGMEDDESETPEPRRSLLRVFTPALVSVTLKGIDISIGVLALCPNLEELHLEGGIVYGTAQLEALTIINSNKSSVVWPLVNTKGLPDLWRLKRLRCTYPNRALSKTLSEIQSLDELELTVIVDKGPPKPLPKDNGSFGTQLRKAFSAYSSLRKLERFTLILGESWEPTLSQAIIAILDALAKEGPFDCLKGLKFTARMMYNALLVRHLSCTDDIVTALTSFSQKLSSEKWRGVKSIDIVVKYMAGPDEKRSTGGLAGAISEYCSPDQVAKRRDAVKSLADVGVQLNVSYCDVFVAGHAKMARQLDPAAGDLYYGPRFSYDSKLMLGWTVDREDFA